MQHVREELALIQPAEKFQYILKSAHNVAAALNLELLMMPRFRKPPARYTGMGQAYCADTITINYHTQFFELLEPTVADLATRFI